jgi:phytoene synthase
MYTLCYDWVMIISAQQGTASAAQVTAINEWEQRLNALAQAGSGEAAYPVPIRADVSRLQDAFDACREIAARYSRSFSLASGLLPAEKRRAMRALYAFCRTADNLADENIQNPEEKLETLRRAVLTPQHLSDDDVLLAWADIQSRYQIPAGYALQLIDGVKADLDGQCYRTFEDLAEYCYRVASTVGLMSMHITGFSDKRAVPYAIKLGVALQLTNILRDVAEDWAAGRLYLPLDELAAFGLSAKTIGRAEIDQRWRAFISSQIARARRLYAEALPGIGLLHPDGRLAVAAAAFLYRGILDDIERHDYDVFHRRAYVPGRYKAHALLKAWSYTRQLAAKKGSWYYEQSIIQEGQHEI